MEQKTVIQNLKRNVKKKPKKLLNDQLTIKLMYDYPMSLNAVSKKTSDLYWCFQVEQVEEIKKAKTDDTTESKKEVVAEEAKTEEATA